jgi:hypothetical protein
MSVFDGVNGLTNVQARRGDVIGVHRSGALYDHYGVYESPECVYEYSGEPGNMENACVQTTTLKAFVKDSGGYFIRVFPERYEDFDSPRKRDLKACAALRGSSGGLLKTTAARLCAASEQAYAASYHLYTPDETIRRARSRLGSGSMTWDSITASITRSGAKPGSGNPVRWTRCWTAWKPFGSN